LLNVSEPFLYIAVFALMRVSRMKNTMLILWKAACS